MKDIIAYVILMLYSGLWFSAAIFLIFLVIPYTVKNKDIPFIHGVLTYPIGIICAMIYFAFTK